MAVDNNDNKNGDKKERRRKRRWGSKQEEAPATATTTAATTAAAGASKSKVLAMQESIKARLAAAKAKQQAGVKRPAESSTPAAAVPDNKAKRARHYELDMSVTGPTFQKQQDAAAASKANKAAKPKINPYLAHRVPPPPKPSIKKDTGGKKKDDTTGDNAIISKEEQASTEKADGEANVDDFLVDDDVDLRLERVTKERKQRRELKFVEPGHYQQIAEKKREKALKAEASGYVSGRKTGHTIQSASMADMYGPSGGATEGSGGATGGDIDDDLLVNLPPRIDANPDVRMPLIMEWWDTALLPSKLKKEVAAQEAQLLTKQSKEAMQKLAPVATEEDSKPAAIPDGSDDKKTGNDDEDDDDDEDPAIQDLRNRCYEQASLAYSKTAELVQHIIPIQPYKKPEPKPVLHLTKKERKKQRKLRRQGKQREIQDMQAAGLTPAPEPRLTLKNFIRVLGDQAYLDPSQMEAKVQEQMQVRQRAHLEKNASNKLTKEQRSEKRWRKLQKEDEQGGIAVALFWVADMSHPYHRTKLDLNAQQNNITGGVLECASPQLALVVCEGNPKAMKRYRRLMEVRMKWTGPDDQPDEDDDDDDDDDIGDGEEGKEITRKFNPNNECHLVWNGMSVKRHFKGFIFQACDKPEQARKVLKQKGVAHYWDQVLEFHNDKTKRLGGGAELQLRLAADDSDDDDDDDIVMREDERKDEDVVMEDAN